MYSKELLVNWLWGILSNFLEQNCWKCCNFRWKNNTGPIYFNIIKSDTKHSEAVTQLFCNCWAVIFDAEKNRSFPSVVLFSIYERQRCMSYFSSTCSLRNIVCYSVTKRSFTRTFRQQRFSARCNSCLCHHRCVLISDKTVDTINLSITKHWNSVTFLEGKWI